MTMVPRSIFTPSLFEAEISVLPTTPTAEMTALDGEAKSGGTLAVVDGRGDAVGTSCRALPPWRR